MFNHLQISDLLSLLGQVLNPLIVLNRTLDVFNPSLNCLLVTGKHDVLLPCIVFKREIETILLLEPNICRVLGIADLIEHVDLSGFVGVIRLLFVLDQGTLDWV